MRLERSGRVSDVRVEKSSGDKQFDASAVQAVRRASPFPPVPDSAQSLLGDLRMVLAPTRPVPEQFPGKRLDLSQSGRDEVKVPIISILRTMLSRVRSIELKLLPREPYSFNLTTHSERTRVRAERDRVT